MTAEEKRYAEARMRVARARARALETSSELKERLAPQSLANKAFQSARAAGEEAAERGLATVKAHPLPAAGAGIATTMLIFRRPLWRGLRRLFSHKRHDAPSK